MRQVPFLIFVRAPRLLTMLGLSQVSEWILCTFRESEVFCASLSRDFCDEVCSFVSLIYFSLSVFCIQFQRGGAVTQLLPWSHQIWPAAAAMKKKQDCLQLNTFSF